jgi:ABC-type multidrug transport system fused ATPase/permease subunit
VQRLALARALLRRPRFLVLDEATSGLDLRTERAVLAALEAIGPETTILVIAHRPSTMARCSRLLLLEDGQIRDQGGYEQLLRESASFRRLLVNGGSEATARPG